MLPGSARAELQRLARTVGMIALDVGARGGISEDLMLLSQAVDYYGFEPDPIECEKLNLSTANAPWRSVTFLPTALAAKDGTFALNLYRRRGCSSKLQAVQHNGALFSRGDYFIHEDTIEVPALRLDSIISKHSINAPAFMKIDVQGMEVECFSGAPNALSNDLVGIRTEVAFFQLYKEQPLFAEVDQALREYGFVPMRWVEFHEWRRSTRVKLPRVVSGDFPYSKGQMMHGDLLYLLHPESLPDYTDSEIGRLVRLGLIACCYDHFDHACAVFSRPRVRDFCETFAKSDPIVAIKRLSKVKARRWKGIPGLLRRLIRQ